MELDKAVERIAASKGLREWVKRGIEYGCPGGVHLEELQPPNCSDDNCIECWLKAFGCDGEIDKEEL